MGKIRINKLALELNVQNDWIIDELGKKDILVKNHMSSIDEESAQYIRDLVTGAKEDKDKKKSGGKKTAAAKSVGGKAG